MLQPRHLHIGEDAPAPTPEEAEDEIIRVNSARFAALVEREEDPLHLDAEPAQLDVQQVARKYKTDLTRGLTANEAKIVLERDGPNELEAKPAPTFCQLFLLQLTGFIIIMLICAAIASAIVTATGPLKHDLLNYSTAIAIFILVFLNAGIAAYTEHQAGGALEALAKMSQPSIECIRGGESVSVDTKELVRGDLVCLQTGDVIPADIRLTEANDVKVNEAGLTGEPHEIKKTNKIYDPSQNLALPSNIVFSGCTMMNGKGKGIVIDTGMDTSIGKIAGLMQEEEIVDEDGNPVNKKKGLFSCLPDTTANQTPLQKNVEKLGANIGIAAIILCLIIFIVGLVLKVEDPKNPEGATWLYMILIAVTLAVAAIPEGIPLTLTIALSWGCNQMVKNKVLVTKIAAVETLGSASVICSDKTGTLTQGQMQMTKMYSGGKTYNISGHKFDPVGEVIDANTSLPAKEDVGVRSTLLTAMMCSSTRIVQDETGEWKPEGNASEAPIVVAGRKVGFNEDQVGADYPRIFEVPFNSTIKMMLTISKVDGRPQLCSKGINLPPGTNFLAVFKGAPNYILDVCSGMMGPAGNVEPLPPDRRAQLDAVVDNFSDQALRVLAVAVKPLAALPFAPEDEAMATDAKLQSVKHDLQFVGFVASIDPERPGVKMSVDTSRTAGIRVVMITGDYLKTAIAIAKNVHILVDEDDPSTDALDCVSLRPKGESEYISEDKMDELTSRVRVFARAKPADKLEIVKSLQRQGKVTAMTGDGVNDAPALNRADIGVAMGIQGTEVAKGAADMILQDDNFVNIVSAVEKGRTIYAGIQKFVAFIMSVHIAEVLQIVTCIFGGIPLMRTPLQILFLILVTDLPPSIALGMEPGEDTILLRMPRPKDEPVVLCWMWVSICLNGIIVAAVIIGVYIYALIYYCDGEIFQTDILDGTTDEELESQRISINNARTVAFIALVWSENVRAYCSRSFDQPVCKNLCGNAIMQYAVVIAQIALYAAVLLPFFSDTILELRGMYIGAWGWGVALIGPVGTLVLCEACKIITKYQMRAHEEAKALAESDGEGSSDEEE